LLPAKKLNKEGKQFLSQYQHLLHLSAGSTYTRSPAFLPKSITANEKE